jgi:SAM-dependent methyltransferase
MSETKIVEDSHAGAQHFSDLVRPTLNREANPRILVAGCGPAHEALHIRQDLDIPVVGVDIEPLWDPACGAGVDNFELMQHSILDLPFPDSSFDIVFYHHVIEHVSDPAKSLDELHRVLKPGGLIYVGTPNRHRAVGYLGGYGVTVAEKLKWNWADYKARLRGRFRNEYGAHAGFSDKELARLLNRRFIDVQSLTADYITFKYGKRLPPSALKAVCTQPLREVAAASVYATARKAR